ncbi:MAG: hypothetical protein ABS46_10075 [Cytophagaceae bacterium SCN 52-12]|nr:MAG: hypothetical protein ABS46_10075 [Cytophagaceae bacterium SCN 52-12]
MNTTKALFSPLEYFSDRILLIAGLAASAAGLGLSVGFDVAQDGIFDLHIARLPFQTHLLFLTGNILLTALGLFFIGKIINSGTRLIDMVKVGMIARIPLYLAIPLIGNKTMISLTERLVKQTTGNSLPQLEASDMALLLFLSLVSVLCIAGFFVLLVNGFRVAANAKKWQHYLLLAAVVLATEVLSKFLYTKMVALL